MSKPPIESMLDAVEWKPIPQDETGFDVSIPHATSEGVLRFGGLEFKVYQLSTGERVIDSESMEAFLGGLSND